MKKLSFIFVLALFAISLTAQSPQSFNYQAVIRDGSGNIIKNTAVGIRISVLQGNVSGTVVCMEEFAPVTNEFGLVNLVIGSVNPVFCCY